MQCCLKLPVIHYTNKLDSDKFFEIDTILQHEYFRKQRKYGERTLEINVIPGSLLIVTISMSNLSWPYPRPLSRYFTSSGVEKSREDIRFRWSQMDVLSLFSPQASASLLQIYAATELKMAQFPTYFGVQSCDTAEQRWVTVSGWRMWLTHLCSAQIPASPSYQHKRELCKQSVQFSCI